MTQQASSQGTFTQIPNIIYDRCDLPEEVIYTFEKLCRQVGHKGGIYAGSYSKLAEQLRTSKNKAFRMVKALDTAHLLTIDESAGKLLLTLNTANLWILNTLADNNFPVPYWTDLEATINFVLKIERNKQDIITNASEIVLNLKQSVLKIEQTVLILERIGLKIERSVLELERQESLEKQPVEYAEIPAVKPPNTSNTKNTVKTSNTGKASASHKPTQPLLIDPTKEKKLEKPTTTLDTPEQEAFWLLWCNVWFNREVQPTLNATAKGHVINLAPRFKTQEQLDSYERFTRKELEESGYKRKTIFLGNLDNNDRYIRWKQTQPAPVSPAQLSQNKPTSGFDIEARKKLLEERKRALAG